MTTPKSEAELAMPDPESNAIGPLDLRSATRFLFAEPRLRNYAFTALGSLAVIFLFMMERGSDVGGLLIVIVGVSGVLLRWTPAPVLVLLLLSYFLWTPTGIPDEGYPESFSFEERRFNLADAIFVIAGACYLISQYRILALVQRALFSESEGYSQEEPAVRRPASNITAVELTHMLAAAVVLVIAAEAIWLILTRVAIDPGASFPFRIRSARDALREGQTGAWRSRLYVLLGLLFFVTVTARIVFSYWRFRTMGPAEARMILLDDSWRETHRERSRLEKWRVWGRNRAKGTDSKITRGDKS
jgi:hypothetical protein